MRRLMLLAACALLAGCGGGGNDGAAPTATVTTAESPPATTAVSVYWLLGGEVWPALREVEETEAVATAALEALVDGPSAEEADELGLESALPGELEIGSVAVVDGVASIELSEGLTGAALAQVVYTVSQFPTVDAVEVEGERWTRADFEDLTPAILVESPRLFEPVGNPLRATGTANTFEATFQYELTDPDGRIVDQGFVTATSGSGTRGTFDFTTGEYEIPFDGVGALHVFELSAQDGSKTNLVEIPVRMSG